MAFPRVILLPNGLAMVLERRKRVHSWSALRAPAAQDVHALHPHVSVVGDGRVGGAGPDARERSHETEHEAARGPTGEAQVERVVDEDGRLQHHDKVTDR